ncbi:MAG: AIR carboxylase family protein, partial [Candidatus Heimdallarchaeota archaeon]|nr:AIR carboxylase family protein [Candidatus Heimdallarchaeota archaeon]
TKTQIHHIIEHINLNGWKYECDSFSRTMIIHSDIIEKPKNELSVAIFSGGTSDRFIVEEIIMCVRFFGYSCKSYQDIGVAGYHRFQPALEEVENNINIKCLIIVAGQEGALFPVISGQTRLPIIAVPSPVGYGYKGGGESALITALQTCAPGIGVVNIANGFGAAALASKILNLFNLS